MVWWNDKSHKWWIDMKKRHGRTARVGTLGKEFSQTSCKDEKMEAQVENGIIEDDGVMADEERRPWWVWRSLQAADCVTWRRRPRRKWVMGWHKLWLMLSQISRPDPASVCPSSQWTGRLSLKWSIQKSLEWLSVVHFQNYKRTEINKYKVQSLCVFYSVTDKTCF